MAKHARKTLRPTPRGVTVGLLAAVGVIGYNLPTGGDDIPLAAPSASASEVIVAEAQGEEVLVPVEVVEAQAPVADAMVLPKEEHDALPGPEVTATPETDPIDAAVEAVVAHEEPAPVVEVTDSTPEPVIHEEPVVEEVIYEDDPRFDCRTMGNRQCGTQIEGTWYVVTFDAGGAPLSVRVR